MVASFDDPENRHRPERALQIYQVLIALAHNRQTITYGGLAEVIGFKGAGVFAHILGIIMTWCESNDLPPLTALVVGQGGAPGDGLVTTINVDADREDVYGTEWYRFFPPLIEDLRAIQAGR